MPFAHGVVIQKQGLGDFLAAPAGVEKHQRIGPPCQPVLHQTIPRQGDQVGAVLRRQKSSPNHATDKNRKIAQWQEIFRIFNDSTYIYHSMAHVGLLNFTHEYQISNATWRMERSSLSRNNHKRNPSSINEHVSGSISGESGEGNFASLLTTTLKALKLSYPNHTIHWLHGRLWLRPMRVQDGPIPELDSVFVPSPDSPAHNNTVT